MDQKQLISVKDILFRYRKDAERPALDGVSLEVYEGEWLAIVGHNGSGKSTLARALNGLILPEAGDIEVGGMKLTEDTVWDVRKKIGMVFQNPDNQFVGTTVRDDVAFTYSPITEKHLDTGMSLKEISEAAIRYSDNTAGNILLQQLGGPKGFEKSLKQIGDHVTKADRFETDLNSAIPGDIRDTSTAKALATDLKAFTLGNTLTTDKRTILTDWMRGNATGDELIRAGAPAGWEVGDKSGAGSYGTRNDIAIVWPPDRAPIVLAILTKRFTKDAEYDNALIAEAAKVALDDLK